MNYQFSQEAHESVSEYDGDIAHELLNFIEEASEDGFYNHDSYSYIYDHRGGVWDKLDAKRGGLSHRIFFREKDAKVYILEIFERSEIDYEDKGLYKRLEGVVHKED